MKPSYIKTALKKTVFSMERDPKDFTRHPESDFSRKRKISFSDLVFCTLSMEDHSLNRELRHFFSECKARIPTRSAFVQQRKKLNDKAFPHLFEAINSILPLKKKYKGLHLLACDGSDIDIPPLKQDCETFVSSNTPGVGFHQVHLNALYDILEERYTDVVIQKGSMIDEREALIEMASRNKLSGKCLFIADRGYFSTNLVAHLLQAGHFFLLRMNDPGCRNSFLKRFSLPPENEFDQWVTIKVTRKSSDHHLSHPSDYYVARRSRPFDLIPVDDKDSYFELSFRVIKIQLQDSCEYLLTNLPAKSFNLQELNDLYHMRWGIETSFRYLKYNVALNSFHSILRDLIFQEIYARLILYNITMLLIHSVKLPKKDLKYARKLSVSDAVVTCRYFLIHYLTNEYIKELLLKYLTDIRPGRLFPRKTRSKRFVPLTNRT